VPPDSRQLTIDTPDGQGMGGFLTVPEAGSGPGVLVLMEIFGVGGYIRQATVRLAELGYVAYAPDLYRRVDPGLELAHDEESMQQAFAAMQRLDLAGAVDDAETALHTLRRLPEVGGRAVGVLGFCLGGRLAWGLAAQSDPAVAVCYYGSDIAESLGLAERIECPLLLHFGAEDPYIPIEAVERVAEMARGRDGWECHIQSDGGHAFDNHESEIFHRPAAAARAWELTSQFLARTLV
jgi:carboxymethylenebutenolidase